MSPLSEARRDTRSSGWLITRLAVMMLLQFWPLGCWWVAVNDFIAANTGGAGAQIFSGWFQGFLGSTMAIGGLVTPAVLGWVADRFVPANRLLSILHVAAAMSLWGLHRAESQTAFYLAMIFYFQALTPSFSLTNTVAMGSLVDGQREFPAIRLYGTVAWVVAGVFMGIFCPQVLGIDSIETSRLPIAIAAWSHLAMSAYSLTLPAGTRAGRGGAVSVRGGGMALLSNPTVAGFLLISLVVAATSLPYNMAQTFMTQWGDEHAVATLTLGQLTEVACLGCLATLKRRVPLKLLFTLGVGAWALRYTLLSIAASVDIGWGGTVLVYSAILMHGPAFAFVYVVGQQYLDKIAPESRGLGQGIHMMATGGVGHLVGAALTGWVQSVYLTPDGVNPAPYHWGPFWFAPVLPAVAMGVLFWFWFGGRVTNGAEGSAANTERTGV